MTDTTILEPAASTTQDVSSLVTRLSSQGCSRHTIASALNSMGLLTPQGRRWHATSVQHLLRELRLR